MKKDFQQIALVLLFIMNNIISVNAETIGKENENTNKTALSEQSSILKLDEVNNSYDVIVYGGTSGGVMAAVASAKEGASVLLIEPGNHIGGMTSSGLGYVDIGKSFTTGGLTNDFFQRNARFHNKKGVFYKTTPAAAEKLFYEMMEENKVNILLNARLKENTSPKMQGKRITSIVLESNQTISAQYFIDATYEGDLMAQANVSYIVGRESQKQYNEPGAGIRKPYATYFSAYDNAGELLPDVYDGKLNQFGETDNRTQAYNFRMCLTQRKENFIPITKPEKYDPLRYEVLLQTIVNSKQEKNIRSFVSIMPLPDDKTDFNNNGMFSTDLVNGSWEYPEAGYAKREEIWNDHKNYVQGFFYFLGNDPRVPEKLKEEVKSWGLCKDEFVDNNYWPHQLYVREARRMTGAYVMNQKDAWDEPTKPDAIGMGSYMIDSHFVTRYVENGVVKTEGLTGHQPVRPYEIPYKIITPRKNECENLLVSTCMSASHVMYGSLRMEPVYMIVGESAGTAVVQALKNNRQAVQDIDVAVLQKKLKQNGQILSYENTGIYTKDDFQGIILDDTDAKYTGYWGTSANSTPFMESSGYKYTTKAGENATATYKTKVSESGEYDIFYLYAPGANRASNLVMEINYPGGKESLPINMRNNIPDMYYPFVKLISINLKANDELKFFIDANNSDGLVVADAFLIKLADKKTLKKTSSGKSIQYTADSHLGNNKPSNVGDSNGKTRWISSNEGTEHWLKVDFVEATTISNMLVYGGSPTNEEGKAIYPNRNYVIQYERNGEWITVASVSNNKELNLEHKFAVISTKSIRLLFNTGDKGQIRIADIEFNTETKPVAQLDSQIQTDANKKQSNTKQTVEPSTQISGRINLVTQKGVKITADSEMDINFASKAGDGKSATRWISSKEGSEHWIQINFPKEFSISTIRVLGGSPLNNVGKAVYPNRNYRIYFNNNGNWEAIGEIKNNLELNLEHKFQPVTTNALRFEFNTNNSGQVRLSEIECF